MTIYEFWDITPRQFYLKFKGWQKQKKIDLELNIAYHRFFVTNLLNQNLSKKEKIQPHQLIPLSFDKEIITQVPELETVKDSISNMNKLVEDQKGKKRRELSDLDLIELFG